MLFRGAGLTPVPLIFYMSGKKNNKKKSSKRVGGRPGWFRKYPAWCYFLGIGLIAALYVFLFYYLFVDPFSFRWRAIFQEPTYPDGYNIRGIDISHYQEKIDWSLVRNANLNNDPIRFIIIKATEGVTLLDENFNDNFFNARENDFIRGAYHFFVTNQDPERQARFYLHQVHLEEGDLPPILDVEKIGRLSKEQLQKAVKKWLDVVEAEYGVKPILYTSYKFRVDYLNDPVFDEYPFWIAHYYVDKLKYTGQWTFWQHTDCGNVDGIKGDVDCNIFNGSLRQLHKFTLKE